MSKFINQLKTKAYLTATVLITGLLLNQSAQAGLLYNIVDLGTLGGNSFGSAINASGQVVGTSIVGGISHAFVSDGRGPMIDLGTPGISSTGLAINSSGQVTGSSFGGYGLAYIRNSDGTQLNLGTLGGNWSYGYGINDAGQVTGFAEILDGSKHAFVADSHGSMLDLGTLGGKNSYGNDINVAGKVSGFSQTDNGAIHAFITNDSGGMTDLGTLGGINSYGSKINAEGIVTGKAQKENGSYHAFVTNNSGGLVDLGSLSGNSQGYDINDLGVVVGAYGFDNNNNVLDYRAFVIENGDMKDLTSLLVTGSMEWQLNWAGGINNLGQITGQGTHDGLKRAFLLTPVSVPVPAAFWLMASGLLGLLGFNARRR